MAKDAEKIEAAVAAGTALTIVTEASVPVAMDKALQAVNLPFGAPGQLLSEVFFHLPGGLMHFAYENSAHTKDGVLILWAIASFLCLTTVILADEIALHFRSTVRQRTTPR